MNTDRNRGMVMAVCGILVLALNVVEAVNRGATALNLITIAVGAFLLFWGFGLVARNPR